MRYKTLSGVNQVKPITDQLGGSQSSQVSQSQISWGGVRAGIGQFRLIVNEAEAWMAVACKHTHTQYVSVTLIN